MKDKKKKWTGKRAHSEEAEFKYQSISSGMARKFYMGQILQKQVRTHLQKNLRNEAETEALLRLQGGLGALAKARKWTASKEEMMRFWALAEKERLDRKKGLTTDEVSDVVDFFNGINSNDVISLLNGSEILGWRDMHITMKVK